jgi:glycosyltransferase involved in cell wall biosynthesis
MKSIVFTSPILEHPAAGGPQLRIENSIKALGRCSKLQVISRVARENIGRIRDVDYLRQLCTEFHFSPSVSGLSSSNFLIWRAYRKARRFLFPNISLEKDIVFFADFVKKVEADILWFGYGNISLPLIKCLRDRLPNVKFVCDTDSVWSRFILRALDVESDPQKREKIKIEGALKEEEEKDMVKLCDVVTAVSEIDAEYYRSIAPDSKKIHIFSNGIDLDSYISLSPPPKNYCKPALFLGGTYGDETSPMGYAAKWLVQEVMPLVWKENPKVHLYLVGNGSNIFCSSLLGKNVTATGKLDSVLPYLCNAACSLVPLFFESGTRFKIMESAACDIPIVSTTLGAEGIPVVHERDCLIADNPNNFSDSILKIISNPAFAKMLIKNCRKIVADHYGIDNLVKEAKLIIEYLS